ncbi:MAG: flagellar hook protein FlgE [Holophaga sp.]|jgi:flagellar hook protein FlgE
MSLYSAFYASLSGLSSNANALGVIGNNLANLNTIGFKTSSTSFEDLFNTALGGASTEGNGNPMQIGLGTALASVAQDFSQGSPQGTGTVTNMALQGDGFFTLRSPSGTALYSRAGQFTIDKNGFLVDPNGNSVMGWNAVNGVANANGTPVPVFLNPGATSPPFATTTLSNTTNLNSAATAGTTFTAPVPVYDSLGASHNVLITYTATATAGTWDVAATTDGGATVTLSGLPTDAVTGKPCVVFNNDGSLKTPAVGTATTMTLAGWTDGAAGQTITWNIWSGAGASAASNLTSYAQASGTTATTQNGYAAGSVSSMSVDQNGNIVGTFTNGQTMTLAQVAVATFSNNNGLSLQAGNTWTTTLASGAANVGAANTGGRGTILGSNLESSNVDVATEFTNLIINQNGYQANSRVITTTDTLLQTVISMIQA